MKYTHPKSYKGVKYNTPNAQRIMRLFVEKHCLSCDLFCGKEHDFEECRGGCCPNQLDVPLCENCGIEAKYPVERDGTDA